MLTKNNIIRICSLADKQGRKSEGMFVAEGYKLVSEMLESDFTVREIYALPEIIDSLPFFDNIYEVTPKQMERISNLKTPSNVVAVIELPQWEYRLEDIKDKLTIALDGIQDPGNLGTIIRLADWFGVENIFCSMNCADCFNPKVVQATMGAVSRVKVHYCDLQEALSQAAGSGIPIYGAFLEGGNIYKTELFQSAIVLMGSEGKGISPALERYVSDKIYIPPYPREGGVSESLNVAVATAIVCSEIRRRVLAR